MTSLDYIAIVLVAVLVIAQYRLPALLKRYEKYIYVAILALIGATLLYEVHTSFSALINAPPPDRYYAPPYNSISFFLISSWSRIVAPYVLSMIISVIALWALLKPSRYQDRFEAGEPYMIATSLALLRHPFWLIYACVAIVLYLLLSIYKTKRHGAAARVSFYRVWLPLTFIVLAATPLLARITGLDVISFANLH